MTSTHRPCTRCGLPTARTCCRDCYHPYRQETAVNSPYDRPADDPRDDWRKSASCLGLADRDCDPWFPERGAGADDVAKRATAFADAKRICDKCPVSRECLDDALAGPLPQGMRAGLTPGQLKDVERARLKQRYTA